MPELSRELKSCGLKSKDTVCQRVIARFGGQDYTVVQRYEPVLAVLRRDAPVISRAPTHLVLKAVDVAESAGRGGGAVRKLVSGDQVRLVKNGKRLGVAGAERRADRLYSG